MIHRQNKRKNSIENCRNKEFIMQRPYYHKEELGNICIKEYLEMDKQLLDMIDASDDCFPFEFADIFLQGVCQLFAYALNEQFGYPVYIIEELPEPKKVHVFCKSNDKEKYIDIRGITSIFNTLMKEKILFGCSSDTSKEYLFVEDDFSGDYYSIALDFARSIIEADKSRYQL